MNTSVESDSTTIHRYDSLNYVNTDHLLRDQTQARRLHEPGLMISTIDPITGNEIDDLEGKPYLVDGDLVIYFESDQTRREYREMPLDHPVHLPDNPDEDWVAEG